MSLAQHFPLCSCLPQGRHSHSHSHGDKAGAHGTSGLPTVTSWTRWCPGGPAGARWVQ